MYPTIELSHFTIYTFGTILAITWLLFFVLLHRFSWRYGITKHIFRYVIPFTFSMFFFGRLFSILSEWVDQQFIFHEIFRGNFIAFLRGFFLPEDYFFSLFGAILGFFLVFYILTRHEPDNRLRYFDIAISAFLCVLPIGYFGALLGGQVYGIGFSSFFSIVYNHKHSIVDYQNPLFPLPVLYIIIFTLIYILIRILEKKDLPIGYRGFIGMGLFSITIFLGEFLSGKRGDIFYDYISLSLSQIGALIGIVIAFIGILSFARNP